MARERLLPGELPVRSNFPRYQDQKSVEAAVKKTSSSSPENGTNMSDRAIRKLRAGPAEGDRGTDLGATKQQRQHTRNDLSQAGEG
jgi:hypothetical protein